MARTYKVYHTAQKQIEAMRGFFVEFGRLVPRSRHMLPVDVGDK